MVNNVSLLLDNKKVFSSLLFSSLLFSVSSLSSSLTLLMLFSSLLNSQALLFF